MLLRFQNRSIVISEETIEVDPKVINPEGRKIGEIKTKPNYKNSNLLNIDKFKLDNDFSNTHTYKYYTQAVINASKKQGAVMNIECLDDECISSMLEIGELNDSCEKLIIRK